jgi:lipopolysaccharide transport system ATP-binding protein
MMNLLSTNAIEIKDLSKIYRIYPSPLHRLKEIVSKRKLHSDFVALDNINLAIRKGETFGVIGENGAGKSTFLKIVARTLHPTRGEIATNGRISALLELGAGFNSELTGEENIFLNAYLMGLSKQEIEAKKDGIIDFSELGAFIKRPVKTYSSGMHVRLAFAIATSVDPDILIVDEALAVGDNHFQKKCVDRMMNFKRSGKTILFCSHSMYLVQELCEKAMWLHKGEIQGVGDAGSVISQYQNFEREKEAILRKESPRESHSANVDASGPIIITSVSIRDKYNNAVEMINPLEPLNITMKVSCTGKDLKGHIGFAVIRNDDIMCFGTMTHFDGLEPIRYHDDQEFALIMQKCPLLTGTYKIMAVVGDEHGMHPYDIKYSSPFVVSSKLKEFGMTYMEHSWKLQTD